MKTLPLNRHVGRCAGLAILCAFCLVPGTLTAAAPAAIELPADPPATRTVTLQEMWRVGGEYDEEILLGVVARAVMDDQGLTYLLDRQLSQVLVIDQDGFLVTTLGREGEGPGEMTRPGDLFLMDQGRVGVTQGFPGKIVILNDDGTPGGTISIGESDQTGGFHFMGRAAMRAGNLVVHSGRGTFDMEAGKNTSVSSLALLDEQGNELTRFVEHTTVSDFTRHEYNEEKSFSELDTWALGDDVLYTVPERDAYLIRQYAMDGTVQAAWRRPFTPRERSQEDKDDLTAGMRIIVNGVRQEIEKHVLDHDPPIMGLNVAPDGRLFVINSHGQRKLLEGEAMARYDVISPDGSLLEELTLQVPDADQEQDRLIFLDGRHWLLIRNYEAASDAMNAGFAGEDEEEPEDLGYAEPLEVVLYMMPD